MRARRLGRVVGLGARRRRQQQLDRLAAVLGRVDLAVDARLVRLDECVGRLEDVLRRAVGRVQVDPARAGEVVLELHDVLDARAPPLVDGLVGVSDDEHVVAVVGELADEDVLRQVRVLVLVDQQVLELVLVLLADVLVLVEQPDAPQHHVVEVEHVLIEQLLLVDAGHLGHRLPELGLRPLIGVVGVLQVVLDRRDVLQHALGLDPARAPAHFPQRLVQQLVLVLRRCDPVVRVDPHPVPVLAQDPSAHAVERRHVHVLPVERAEHSVHPLLHLVGGLARERDRGDVARLHPPDLDQVGDSRADHRGLAGPGPGQDQRGSVPGGDRLHLARVELLQQRVVPPPVVDFWPARLGLLFHHFGPRCFRHCAGPFLPYRACVGADRARSWAAP